MAFYYQTEYRLGRRGRIRRSYTGIRAFVAIFLDLVFGLIFETVATAMALVFRVVTLAFQLAMHVIKTGGKILVAALAAVVFILTLPFALVHQAVQRAGSIRPDGHGAGPAALKPDWALGREL
jgi:hypothetical protein